MAFDPELADRIRQLLADERDVTERKMFGGLAFLVAGHMAVVARGHGGLMVRVDPAESDRLLDTSTAQLVEMRGRPMRGWLRLDTDALRSKQALSRWVTLGLRFVRSLPPKV